MSVQIKGVGTIGGIDQGLNTVGVITATAFHGDGSQLTNLPAQATIANNADNRVITGGSGVNLNAEANVLYDGTNFGIGKSPSRTLDVQGKIRSSDSVCFGDNSSTPSEGAAIHRPAASSLAFVTNNAERVRITSAGKIGIADANPQSKLSVSDAGSTSDPVIMAHVSGSNGGILGFGLYSSVNNKYTFKVTNNGRVQVNDGIDFSLTSNAAGMTSELLDDYEEGSWTPILTGYSGGNTQTYAVQVGSYTKIGREVTAHFEVKLSNKGNISGSYTLIQGLPFNHAGSRAGSGTINFFSNLNSNISSMGLEGGGGIANSFWVTAVNSTGNTGMSYINTSNISNSTNIVGTLHYRVS